jgi:hypothetical protein
MPRRGKPRRGFPSKRRISGSRGAHRRDPEEQTMIALYDHIQTLRRELRSCAISQRERAQIEAELATAIAEQAEHDQALEDALRTHERDEIG